VSLLVATDTKPLTYEVLQDLPNDGKRREIVGGKLYVSAAPLRTHQKLSGRLHILFHNGVEATGLGEVYYAPVDVRFANGDQVQPDLPVLLNRSLNRYQGNPVLGPPDIVVEILSPSSVSYDLVEKAELYASQGVPEYWVADADRPALRILVLRAGRYEQTAPEPDGRLRSAVVPSLIVDPAQLLANLGN
jgi:Uma2 family endonuclease